MNNRSIKAEIDSLQEEIKRIREQNQKITSNPFYNYSKLYGYNNSNERNQILNRSNYKKQNVRKRDNKKSLVSYLSHYSSSSQITYSSRGKSHPTQNTKKRSNYSEFTQIPSKQGSFSYRKYFHEANENQRRNQHKNNLSLLSQDINLELINEKDNSHSNNDLISQFITFFPKDATELNLNKYKISRMTNIATANSNNNYYFINNNNSNSVCNSERKQMYPSNNVINQLTYNCVPSNHKTPYQNSNIKSVMSQFRTEQKSSKYSNIPLSSLNKFSSKVTKDTCIEYENNKYQYTCYDKVTNEHSPIIGSISTHMIKSPDFLIFNPLSIYTSKIDCDNNQLVLVNLFKNKPINEKESRRMIIEYLKLITKSNNNSSHLLLNLRINTKVLENNTNQSIKNLGDNDQSYDTSLNISLLKSLSSLFNESQGKIHMINFMSMPRILNLIINDETLVPCVFILIPSELTIRHGIETYLFKYKELQNNSFNSIEGYFDLSTLISCTSSNISSLRFILYFHDNNDYNLINKYVIETPSIELRTYYLKGFNSILSKNTHRLRS